MNMDAVIPPEIPDVSYGFDCLILVVAGKLLINQSFILLRSGSQSWILGGTKC